ncbi:MAG: 4Fe-4S single cluster domain-containing protein [Burkholderiaceae bacterium]|nr:4Fe-4S single cluster domain-containing protein [Burkholderiaceae bacterium]
MKIAVNKAHFPVTVLGPGRRIGIWLQGCGIGCKGCVSQDTWARDAGREMTVAQLLIWCREVGGGALDGVTISGGEPFDQPQALAALLDGLIRWRADSAADFDILCYSGYPLARLQKAHEKLLRKLDALIPEPYIDNQPLTHLWRGSANQPLLPLSVRGRDRYAAFVAAVADPAAKRMQAAVDGERIWYVGIPARGDMAALEQSCAQRGVAFDTVSWRP